MHDHGHEKKNAARKKIGRVRAKVLALFFKSFECAAVSGL
jgi:hypothetical protein